jgi:UDP-GlcNAc:undecaprenyl-phosphate/decaprenyl-phosphate GlcNAc-1-phosphate transferase
MRSGTRVATAMSVSDTMAQGRIDYYALVFAGSAMLSLALTPLALKLAMRQKVLDRPQGYKAPRSPVPYLGGLAIMGAFSAAVLVAAIVSPPVGTVDELLPILVMAIALSFMGLMDDLRSLTPHVRLIAEIGAALVVWRTGIGVQLFAYEPLNVIFTVLWVVGITNAFNLLDNMDGLSAGVAAIGAGWFFAIAAANGQFLVAALAAALAGCALGFLRHNFHPARIYMGDAGSLFLGFMLAVLGIKLRFSGPTSVTFLVPILVLAMAILDTSLVTVCRLRAGRSPFQGGRDHVSHRLVFIGISVPMAVGLIYGGALGSGLIALVVSRVDRLSAYLLAGTVLAGHLFVAVLLARVPVYREPSPRPDHLWGESAGTGTSGPRTRQFRIAWLFAPRRRTWGS